MHRRRGTGVGFATAIVLASLVPATTHGASDDDAPDVSKYALPEQMGGSLQPWNRSTIRNDPITANSSFVRAKGVKFVVKDKETMFVGTNAYYLMLRDKITDAHVEHFFQVTSQRGMNLVRFFPFVNGYGGADNGYGGKSTSTPYPLQTSVGTYDETTFKRLDLVLAQAAQSGVRVIMPLSNFEVELGGIKWWVDGVLGPGKDQHLFYTDPAVKAAYKKYINTMLSRNNTITNITYSADPTIMAVELLNEPHTAKLYEKKLGLEPGKMVRDWVFEMAAYVKSIDPNHMVSTGEEGYRADGPTDGVHINWLNGGYKGVDFVGNTACPNIDFATVHCYPDSFAIPAADYSWVKDNYIGDRAKLAHAAGKPFILEEYGGKRGYAGSRDEVLLAIQSAADTHGAAATLVWQVFAWPIQDQEGSYDFDWDQDGSRAQVEQLHYADVKNGNIKASSGTGEAEHSEDDATAEAGAEAKADASIEAMQAAIAEAMRTSNPHLTGQRWLARTALVAAKRAHLEVATPGDDVPGMGRVPTPVAAPSDGGAMPGGGGGGANTTAVGCSDVRPERPDGRPDQNTCEQQAKWGKCGADWMKGYCLKACGLCGTGQRGSARESGNPLIITPVHLP